MTDLYSTIAHLIEERGADQVLYAMSAVLSDSAEELDTTPKLAKMLIENAKRLDKLATSIKNQTSRYRE